MIFTGSDPTASKRRKYDLADQIRRSSKSVSANIAEGIGRYYYMDNVRFCYIARGSLDETLNHLIVARDLGYCPAPLYQELRGQVEEIRRLLNGYVTWLKAKRIGENEPGAKLVIHEISPEYFVESK